MEIFKPHNSILTEPEFAPLPLDLISPDAAGLSAPVGEGSPSLLPGQLPVLTETDTGDVLFAGHFQRAIAQGPPEPPSPALADPLIGNSAVVNQEAIASLGQPGNGVKVEYFDNADFTNRVLTRIEPNINSAWGNGSPHEAIAPDSFSANWTGKLLPEFTETYTFWTSSDDRARLELNGELVFENWESSGTTDKSGTIALSAGQLYDLSFAYSHDRGDAAVDLWWSYPGQTPEIIPLSALHTPETKLSPEPELHPLRFFTKMFYNPGEAVQFRGKVYTGDRDTEKIDFRLQKDGGEWVDISDATQLEASREDPDYAFFNYELSGLEPGRYHLQGIVIDDPLTDSTFTESFTILDLPTETALPDTVVNAIARSADLENYSAEELAGTQQWVVNLRVGEDSSELATALGARDLGPTGHISNSFMWEFPPDVKAMDALSQLDGLQAVQFFYPLISVKLESLTPNDPLFVKQWHLKNTGQTGGKIGVDANVTDALELATGRGVAIAIVDDGLQHTHPDLNGNYRADLSRDFNEGDIETRNYDFDPTPFSQGLTFKAQMENGVGLQEEIPSQYVDFEGTVENLKLTLDIDHPSPENLEVYLYGPNETELELRPGENLSEFTIAAAALEDVSSLGEWELVIENDTSIPGILHDWWLTLDVWNSHGTAVAGVAGASGNNDLGVTGVAPDADLAGLRLIAAQRVEDFQIADALYSEFNQTIDIYNNSWKPPIFWAGPESMMALHQGVTEGRDGLGNIYVFGAGNNGTFGEDLNYNAFANSRHTIAVGAIDHFGKKSSYSQQGSALLVTAPSSNDTGKNKVGITTTDLMGGEGRNVNGNGEYGPNVPDLDYTNDFGGTSSASPVVSGVNALMLEVNPNLTPRDVQHILVETANRDLIDDRRAKWTGADGDAIRHNYKYGFGVVDGSAAVNAAASWTPVAEEVSFSTGTLTTDRLIPDGNPFGVTERIKMEQEMKLEWVEIVLDVSHELRSDLKVELTSPSGTKSLLAFPWIEFPESNAGYDNWEFTTVRHWNESSLGEWELRVVDGFSHISDEAGTWNSVELKFYGTPPTTVEVEATDPIASEDGEEGEFTFSRTGSLDRPVTVHYSLSGTAIEGVDYQTLETAVIPAGEERAIVRVIPSDDAEVEGNETVVVNLVDDVSYGIGANNSATITIADNDVANNAPTLTGIELLTGATVGKSWTIGYDDLMAKSDAVDGDGDPMTLQISAIASGTLTKNGVPVEPFETTLSEGEVVVWTPETAGDEVTAFAVRAFDGTDYSAQVPVKVAVAPLPVVTISATDANASEDGDSGEFAVARSGDTTESLSVSYSTVGDATAGSDYSTIGEIVIPAGSEEVTVAIDPIDDGEIEEDETLVVNLEAGTGYRLGDESSAQVSIADNDFLPRNIVTNTNDSGVGSLRDAIAWANENPGPDTIEFDIPGDGPHTISPASALPNITEEVVIDGWSQNGGTPPATPLIELSGSSAGDSSGLRITGSNVKVRGLVINNWQGHGIEIVDKSATDNWIYGNFIGTNTEGTVAIGNAINGVMVRGDNNIIGTNGDGIADAFEGNLISGNVSPGIMIVSNSNTVAGNRIGTNKDGTGAIANSDSGVFIGNGASNNTIGTNGDGIADVSEGNLISGNVSSGIMIASNSNTVAGNRIGTNKNGTEAIANSGGGVLISNGSNNIIGTNGNEMADAAEANLISGNGGLAGISIYKANSNVVAGNRIGTNVDGTTALGNEFFGVFVNDSSNNIIGTNRNGKADAAEANLISGNRAASGIGIYKINADDESTGNRIQGNSIFANALMGINLANFSRTDRVTTNDIGDGDTGSNNQQNFPELTSVTSDTATTTIQGTLNSTANTTFTLEFFSNSVLDDSGYGEGETPLGFQEVTTDENGNASFTANFSTTVAIGQFITATATDSDGNTSEFSQGIEVRNNDIPIPIDLESQNFFSMGGSSFTAGDSFNVGFNVKNNEPGEAGLFNVGFYLSQDGTITTGDRLLSNYEVSGLEGQTDTGFKTTSLTLPAIGDAFWSGDGEYTLGVIIDSEGAIVESEENNNANTGRFKDFIDNLQISGTGAKPINQSPVASDDTATITQGNTATIAVLGNDSDPDDDSLTIINVSTPASGDVAIDENQVKYTPNPAFTGTDSFTYIIFDGRDGIDMATVNVTVEAES